MEGTGGLISMTQLLPVLVQAEAGLATSITAMTVDLGVVGV